MGNGRCTVTAMVKQSPTVLAIGNFDGVHRGHRELLRQAREKADALGVTLTVLTFEPHPRSLFRPDDPPFRLTPSALKAERLAECDVDYVYAPEFNWDFAGKSAEAFIDDLLIAQLQAAHVFVGEGFHYGAQRKGDVDLMRRHGLNVTALEPVCDAGGEVISSTRIRHLLRHGALEDANALLGWDWIMCGEVVHGDKRGRELGYPTANVPLHETLHPAYGIYAAEVQIAGEAVWRSAAVNIGIRPMFEVKVGQVEAFLLDYEGDLYGRILTVRPVKYLRQEMKFDDLDALVKQMEKDVAATREILF